MSRILNRQRQLAEQGRLRLGYTTEMTTKSGKTVQRPMRSMTWIVTSHSKDYVDTAASLWGGQVEAWQPMGHGAEQWRVITQAKEIPAILPPGEPLTQAYEMWSAGGCQRRCDGVTEQFTGSPCLCIARFGDKWYEQQKGVVCDTVSRLKVILPDMPGMGSWRVETGSFYAADEMSGMIDVIRGTVGDRELIPVRLRIEPRTSTSGGETKQFVVPVLELRGVTAGELLGGRFGGIRAVESARHQQQAIGPGGQIPDYVAIAKQGGTLEHVRAAWREADAHGHLTEGLKSQLFEIGQQFNPGGQNPVHPQAVQPEPATLPDQDTDALWMDIMGAAGRQGMTEAELLEDFAVFGGGVLVDDATAQDMQNYLNHLRKRQAPEGEQS